SQIQQAFMNSAAHRDNILSTSYTQIGVGTARGSDGQLYVDELFRQPTGVTPRAYTPTTRTYTRPASRSSYRAPLRAVHAAPRHPSAARRVPVAVPLTSAFLRQVRQELPGRVHFDPVGGAFG